MLVRWLIFIHVLAAIAFFLFHGVSAVMALRLRKEADFARIRALLDMSQATLPLMGVSLLLMGLTGLTLPFLVHIWDRVYIWLSIVLILGVAISGSLFGAEVHQLLSELGQESLAVSGASILSSTTRADGFVIVPADLEGYPEGAIVNVFLYDVP